MSESEHVKGLLYVDPSKVDTMSADNSASAFEHDPEFQETLRLINLGIQFEDMLSSKPDFLERFKAGSEPKRPPGRPKKPLKKTKDIRRALVVFVTAMNLRREKSLAPNDKLKMTQRGIIREAEKRYPNAKKFLFNPEHPRSIDVSVARGRTRLGIDTNWRNEKCELVLSQVTEDIDKWITS